MNKLQEQDDDELSDYGKIRLMNIKRNNERLLSLGLVSFSSVTKSKPLSNTKRRRRRDLSTLSTRTKLGRAAKEKSIMLPVVPDTIKQTAYNTRSNAVANKKTAAKPVNKIDMSTGTILRRYESGYAAAKDVSGHQSAISNACNQQVKSHKGYCWEFSDGTGETNNKVIKIGKTRVRKQFINKDIGILEWFIGVVSCKSGKYYNIDYDDGDREDMTWKDVLVCMK